MSPPNILYSAALLIAGGVCLFVAAIILTRRRVTGATALLTLLSALAWWDITYAIFWADVPGPNPNFWLDITYLGVVTVPPALFVFSLQLANLTHWLKRPLAVLIYLVPVIVLIIFFHRPLSWIFLRGQTEGKCRLHSRRRACFLVQCSLFLRFDFVRHHPVRADVSAFIWRVSQTGWLGDLCNVDSLGKQHHFYAWH